MQFANPVWLCSAQDLGGHDPQAERALELYDRLGCEDDQHHGGQESKEIAFRGNGLSERIALSLDAEFVLGSWFGLCWFDACAKPAWALSDIVSRVSIFCSTSDSLERQQASIEIC